MNKPDLEIDPMRCPRCRSRYVQSLDMAYSQAARSDSGATLSEFAQRIAPPKQWSTVLIPLVGGLAIGCATYFAITFWWFEIHQYTQLSRGEINDAADVAMVLVGVVAAIAWHFAAATYNRVVWSGAFKKWQRRAVCRRCAHIFVPRVELGDAQE